MDRIFFLTIIVVLLHCPSYRASSWGVNVLVSFCGMLISIFTRYVFYLCDSSAVLQWINSYSISIVALLLTLLWSWMAKTALMCIFKSGTFFRISGCILRVNSQIVIKENSALVYIASYPELCQLETNQSVPMVVSFDQSLYAAYKDSETFRSDDNTAPHCFKAD